MKLFTRIHIIFATFLALAIVTDIFLIGAVGYIHDSYAPDRFSLWKERISAILFCTVGVPVLWVLFSIIHLTVVIRKRAKHQH